MPERAMRPPNRSIVNGKSALRVLGLGVELLDHSVRVGFTWGAISGWKPAKARR
jgi:hypothetical protein